MFQIWMSSSWQWTWTCELPWWSSSIMGGSALSAAITDTFEVGWSICCCWGVSCRLLHQWLSSVTNCHSELKPHNWCNCVCSQRNSLWHGVQLAYLTNQPHLFSRLVVQNGFKVSACWVLWRDGIYWRDSSAQYVPVDPGGSERVCGENTQRKTHSLQHWRNDKGYEAHTSLGGQDFVLKNKVIKITYIHKINWIVSLSFF